jgi:hypothetical protein
MFIVPEKKPPRGIGLRLAGIPFIPLAVINPVKI